MLTYVIDLFSFKRLRQERVKLREENEELQLAQVAGNLKSPPLSYLLRSLDVLCNSSFHLFIGSPMRQLSPGSPPSDDFDLAGSLSPEVKYVHVTRL